MSEHHITCKVSHFCQLQSDLSLLLPITSLVTKNNNNINDALTSSGSGGCIGRNGSLYGHGLGAGGPWNQPFTERRVLVDDTTSATCNKTKLYQIILYVGNRTIDEAIDMQIKLIIYQSCNLKPLGLGSDFSMMYI